MGHAGALGDLAVTSWAANAMKHSPYYVFDAFDARDVVFWFEDKDWGRCDWATRRLIGGPLRRFFRKMRMRFWPLPERGD
jgi:hypothetical protein